jgi:hypothetical protein
MMIHCILIVLGIIQLSLGTTWIGVTVVPEAKGKVGIAVFTTFDDTSFDFSSTWNCSFNLYDPSSPDLYFLEVGPVVAISEDEIVFGQYGGTSFQTSSLVRVDTKARTCTQGPITNTGLYHTLLYDDVRKAIVGVRDIETWTIMYEEIDTVTLKPLQVLYQDKSPHGNAPQGFGAYFNPKTRLFGHVVEVDYFNNNWQLLNFTNTNASVSAYSPFRTNWPPSTLTYNPTTNQLVALYQNSENDPKNGQPQAFYVNPLDGSWPLDGKIYPLAVKNVPQNDAPFRIDSVSGKAVMLVMAFPPYPMESSNNNSADDCTAIILDMSTLSVVRSKAITCTPFGWEDWNWV